MTFRVSANARRVCLALVSLGLGCGPAPTATPPKTTQPAVDPGPAFESPARWVTFPQSVGMPTATLVLDDGKCLVATDDGQRWLITPRDKSVPCAGIGFASGSPAAQTIVGAQRVGEEFRFITESGVVYTSSEPIGPFTRYSPPPVELRRAAARGAAIVGVGWDRNTYYYDGSWKPATMPPASNGFVYAVDVSVDENGHALWLGAPEQILASRDGGKTYAPLTGTPATPGPVGGYEVGMTLHGELAVRGAAGMLVWSLDDDNLVDSPNAVISASASLSVEIEPLVGPRASSVHEQRGVLDGKRYYEIEERAEETRYYLNRGPLGGMLERLPLKSFDACGNVRISAAGGIIGVACIHEVEERPNLAADLYLSKNQGASFELVGSVDTPSFSDLTLSVAQDGTFMLLGACKTPAPKDKKKEESKDDASVSDFPSDPYADICYPKFPLTVKGSTITVGSVPNLEEGSARSPLLSPEGRVGYMLGRNRKDARPAVFVTRDGGHTYQMRTIEAPQSTSWDIDEYGETDPGYVRPLYIHETAQLSLDETGALGVAGDRESGYVWVTLDAEGRVASVAEPPDPSNMIGGAGNRAISLGYGGMDGSFRAWETTDGGATWNEVAITDAMSRYSNMGGFVPCGAAGCLFGDELARVGWEGQLETSLTSMASPLLPEPEVPMGSPISCQLTPKTEWTQLVGRPEERSSQNSWSSYQAGPALPKIREILRGKTLFSVVAIEDETSKVDVTSAVLPDKDGASPTLVTKPLLPPIKGKQPTWTAVSARAQLEGHVALRGKVPTNSYGGVDASKRLDGIEVAWVNELTGVTAKKSVDLDGTWSGGTVQGTQLRTSMLTITGNGVVVRPYSGGQSTYVEEKLTHTFEMPNLQRALTDGGFAVRADAAWLNGAPYAIGFLDRNPTAQAFTTLRGFVPNPKAKPGEPPETPTTFKPFAMTVGPSGAETDWLYHNDQSGVVVLIPGTGLEDPRAYGYLLDKDGNLGAPIELPTLADLPDRPRACTTETRKSTPRTVATHFTSNGTRSYLSGRHPVLVTDPGVAVSGSLTSPVGSLDSMWFLTDGAVLHGTKKEPCVGAWRGSSTRQGSVVVIAGDLSQAFALRTLSGYSKPGGAWVTRLEIRPMTCKYQPDLPVPYDVQARALNRMNDDQP